jgi:hypothetical protein
LLGKISGAVNNWYAICFDNSVVVSRAVNSWHGKFRAKKVDK